MVSNNKVCAVIGKLTYEKTLQVIGNISFAEIRMDLLNFNAEQYKNIYRNINNTIATYRNVSDYPAIEKNYIIAIENNCTYIDLDIELATNLRTKLITKAIANGCKIILSYHNYAKTPTLPELTKTIKKMFAEGAHIAKIACMANKQTDCARIMGLYENHKNIVAFCMGKLGMITRLSAPYFGAPYTYAAASEAEIAPGMLNYNFVNDFFTKLDNT